MGYAKVDSQVLGFLGRALSLEMTAVQQYLSVARLLRLRGFEDIADKFKHEANKEMAHAEKIIGRMMTLGCAPNATQLRPAKLGKSLPEVIKSTEDLEKEIVDFYIQAEEYCMRIDDFDSQLFFKTLLNEEREHAKSLVNWKNNFLFSGSTNI